MKRIIGAVVLAAVLVGCRTTGERVRYLNTESTREEVIDRLGRPDAMRAIGEFEVLTYLERHRKRRSAIFAFNKDYTVILKNGRVVEYGPGVARREGIKNVVIVREE